MSMETVEIPAALLDAITDYLLSRPCRETYPLVRPLDDLAKARETKNHLKPVESFVPMVAKARKAKGALAKVA